MENEIWKDIEGYEGLYQVSNIGRIKSFHHNKEHIIKSWNNKGYRVVSLHKHKEHKKQLIHQLVAKAFIPNPNNYSCINHLDRNRANNTVSNLEWTTHHLNNSYYPTVVYKSQVMTNRKDLSKQVLQLTLDGWLFKKWVSVREIERTLGYPHAIIGECCRENSRRKSAYGFQWRYAD